MAGFVIPRKRLPPLTALAAFEAAARLESFTAAAEELCLTTGAISRQIKSLEEHLDLQLFERVRQRVRLTEEGKSLAVQVRMMLGRLSNLMDQASQLNASFQTLTLGVLPTVATHWLIPKLPGFVERYPFIQLNLVGSARGMDLERESVDAAIVMQSRTWPDTHSFRLGQEDLIAVGSPEWMTRNNVRGPADLLSQNLLVQISRPTLWIQWFHENDVETRSLPRQFQFEEFGMVFEAAVRGLGAGLAPRLLVEADLRSGRLVEVPRCRPLNVADGYAFVYPKHREGFEPLVLFRDWLMEQLDGAAWQWGDSVSDGSSDV